MTLMFLVGGLCLAACGPSAQELAETSAAQTSEAIPPTATVTNTPEPTATALPTKTPEPIAAPEVFLAVVLTEGVLLREGPGTEYPVTESVGEGPVAYELLGYAYDCKWVQVRTRGNGEAWVLEDDALFNVSCEGLEEVAIPPTPASAGGASPDPSGGRGDSNEDDNCGNNIVPIYVDNKTSEDATISFYGDCTYSFSLPTGLSLILVVEGTYTYTFSYCGQTYSGEDAVNSDTQLIFEC